ncbi:MAG: hypothetical protein Q8O16_06990 [Dehalococcoidia bacterium]|nr:hypothetical protein [Dehalococcoidia bacterium]
MEEKTRNEREDDTEIEDIKTQIAQLDIELQRFYDAIANGVMADAASNPINDRRNRKQSLVKRLTEIELEKQRELKIPTVTEAMVNEVLGKVHDLLNVTEP